MTTKQLLLLFEPGEAVFTGSQYQHLPPETSEFFCINPTKDASSRVESDLYNLRNFLIEFDNAPLDQQTASISVIEASGLPIRTATFSGSKSIHLIFSLADTLTVDYRSAWKALAAETILLTGLQPDASCKNPGRLSRLAGATRADTGKVQELVHTGALITNRQLIQLVNKHAIKASVKSSSGVEIDSQMDLATFEQEIQIRAKGIATKTSTVKYWAQPAGCNDIIRNLTLWAIDKTGVPESTFTQYAEAKLLPHLVAAGYPAEKVYRAIRMAYESKT